MRPKARTRQEARRCFIEINRLRIAAGSDVFDDATGSLQELGY